MSDLPATDLPAPDLAPGAAASAAISVAGLHKRYGRFVAVEDVSKHAY